MAPSDDNARSCLWHTLFFADFFTRSRSLLFSSCSSPLVPLDAINKTASKRFSSLCPVFVFLSSLLLSPSPSRRAPLSVHARKDTCRGTQSSVAFLSLSFASLPPKSAVIILSVADAKRFRDVRLHRPALQSFFPKRFLSAPLLDPLHRAHQSVIAIAKHAAVCLISVKRAQGIHASLSFVDVSGTFSWN